MIRLKKPKLPQYEIDARNEQHNRRENKFLKHLNSALTTELSDSDLNEMKNIKLNFDPENISEFEVTITPDEDSLWNRGVYIFKFIIPTSYPFSQPKIFCKTKIYHPCIDFNGNVCTYFIYWRPILRIKDLIFHLLQLFSDPNLMDTEIGRELNYDMEKFRENVEKTLKGGIAFGQEFPQFI